MKPRWRRFFGALGCACFPSWSASGRVCPDLAETGRAAWPDPAAFLIKRPSPRLPGLSRPAIPQAAPIHDIHHRSDRSPPRFEALARLRSMEGAKLCGLLPGLFGAEQQRARYPDIETVNSKVPPQRAYEDARAGHQAQWL